jgi:hypothetical protein
MLIMEKIASDHVLFLSGPIRLRTIHDALNLSSSDTIELALRKFSAAECALQGEEYAMAVAYIASNWYPIAAQSSIAVWKDVP